MANQDRVRIALDAAGSVREKSPEGHLRITRCVLSSACVCPYYGREIPGYQALGLEPDTIYQLYRDPTALQQAASTMDGKPVLMQHKPVSAQDHPKEITVGAVGNAQFDAPDLVGSLTIWDKEAIDAIESGNLKAVSAGYAYKAIPQGGVLNGQPYSLTMVDIVFNHLALVSEPRVPHAIIGDQALTVEAALATKTGKAGAAERRAKLRSVLKPFLAQDAKPEDLEKALDDLEDGTKTPPGAPEPGKGAADGSGDALRNLLAGRVPDDIMDQVLALFQNAETDGGLNVPGGDGSEDDLAQKLKESGLTDDQVALCCAALTPPGLDGGEGSGPHSASEISSREHEAAGAERADMEKRMRASGITEEQIRKFWDSKPDAGKENPPAMDTGISKQAMDAAIARAVQSAEQATVKRVNALHTAREAVKPYVGEVHGMDSAAGVYGFALKDAGYDVKGLDENVLRQMWKNHTQMKDASKKPAARIAQDSAATTSFREDLGLNRIQVKA